MVKVRVKIRFSVQKDLGFDPWRHSEPFIWETYHNNHASIWQFFDSSQLIVLLCNELLIEFLIELLIEFLL